MVKTVLHGLRKKKLRKKNDYVTTINSKKWIYQYRYKNGFINIIIFIFSQNFKWIIRRKRYL